MQLATTRKIQANTAFKAGRLDQAYTLYKEGLDALQRLGLYTDGAAASENTNRSRPFIDVEDILASLAAAEEQDLRANRLMRRLMLNLSLIEYRRGNFQEARLTADAAIQLENHGLDESAKAYYRRGMASLRDPSGDYRQMGREDLEKARRLAPGDENIERALRELTENH